MGKIITHKSDEYSIQYDSEGIDYEVWIGLKRYDLVSRKAYDEAVEQRDNYRHSFEAVMRDPVTYRRVVAERDEAREWARKMMQERDALKEKYEPVDRCVGNPITGKHCPSTHPNVTHCVLCGKEF